MHIACLMPVRNEEWMLGLSARVALMWCDSLIVLDHASADRTTEIIAEIGQEHHGRVHALRLDDDGWPEMSHRQRLLEEARRIGATHCALVDADEVLTGDLLPHVHAAISHLLPGQTLTCGMPCMWRSLDAYRTDGRLWANRDDLVLAFRDAPHLSWQSANGYDHHHRAPLRSVPGGRMRASSGVMHLQWASWRRLTAKHAWYKAMERIKYPGKPVIQIEQMYSQALNERGLRTEAAPAYWWEPYQDLRRHCNLNVEPWHEAEVRRLFEQYGPEMFRGLNLFGVEKQPCAAAALGG